MVETTRENKMKSHIVFVADGVKQVFDCMWHNQTVQIVFSTPPEAGIIIKLETKE